jgi:hypothetical protein
MRKQVAHPEILYKYLSFGEGARGILRDNTIKFTSPLEFNDPFDSRIELLLDAPHDEWKKFFSKRIPEYSAKRMSPAKRVILAAQLARKATAANLSGESFLDYVNDFGVLCLSERRDDLLMWSHYANSHQGICVGFWSGYAHPFFCRALPVDYAEEYPNVSFLESNEKRLETTLLTKSSHWIYEREWRIIEHRRPPGIQPYPRASLACVILGVNISNDFREEIKGMLSNYTTSVELIEAKMCRRRFALEFRAVA